MKIVEKVREYVISTCRNLNRMSDYEFHISIVEDLGLKLAENFKADKEIVQISALLHDIGRIKYGPENHEETGAEEAEKILRELNYDEQKIRKVKECIKEHRHEKPTIPISLEAKILKVADAYSHFKKPIEIVCMRISFGSEIKESIEWMKKKLERDLMFLEEMSKEMKINEIVEECKKAYEAFSFLTK